jgi:hypothetical protein
MNDGHDESGPQDGRFFRQNFVDFNYNLSVKIEASSSSKFFGESRNFEIFENEMVGFGGGQGRVVGRWEVPDKIGDKLDKSV